MIDRQVLQLTKKDLSTTSVSLLSFIGVYKAANGMTFLLFCNLDFGTEDQDNRTPSLSSLFSNSMLKKFIVYCFFFFSVKVVVVVMVFDKWKGKWKFS